jgi:hypothetical protein
MSGTPIPEIKPGFHELSFMAGTNFAYSEAVGGGLKKLALSSPYRPDQLEIMKELTRYTSERCGTITRLESDLLKTKLFPRDIATGKTVILIAKDPYTFEEYDALKKHKKESGSKGNLEDIELKIAREFGKLLSYDDEKINGLIEKHG